MPKSEFLTWALTRWWCWRLRRVCRLPWRPRLGRRSPLDSTSSRACTWTTPSDRRSYQLRIWLVKRRVEERVVAMPMTQYILQFVTTMTKRLLPRVGFTRSWVSNNLVYNNVEAQIGEKIRTLLATSSASENEKYNNISASFTSHNNYCYIFAVISVAFVLRRIGRRWSSTTLRDQRQRNS